MTGTTDARPAATVAPCDDTGCGKPSVIHVRTSGRHLCRADFLLFVERRVKRELRKQGPFPPGSVVAVGLSGGKDSVTALQLVVETFRENASVQVVAVSVDEGIAGYRPEGLAVAAKVAESLGVRHEVVAYRELVGRDLDDLVAARPDAMPCALCGPLRRRALNDAAKKVGATHLATGHNLDDVAQTVLMNVLKGDADRLARMAPHDDPLPGLVPRVLPLRTIPEREVALYAILRGLPFHDGECPHGRAATRGRYRDLLLDLEEREPGTRQALLALQERVATAFRATPRATLRPCRSCGEPAGGETCVPCAIREDVRAA